MPDSLPRSPARVEHLAFTGVEARRYAGYRTMSTELTTLLGAVGVVATMLAVLLPVIRAQGTALRREIDAQGTSLRSEIEALGTSLRSEIAAQGQVIEAQGTSLRREIDALRGDMTELRGDVAELRRDVHDLSDRVARIEGTLNMPGRTTNGAPEPAGSGAGGDGDVAEGGE